MNRRRVLIGGLAALIVYVLIGAAVNYSPDLVQTLAVLGCLAGAIFGSVAK